jgi:hypothetical protein
MSRTRDRKWSLIRAIVHATQRERTRNHADLNNESFRFLHKRD